MEGFDALCACVYAIVASGDEFGTAEGDLVLEDGLVADQNLDWFGFDVELCKRIVRKVRLWFGRLGSKPECLAKDESFSKDKGLAEDVIRHIKVSGYEVGWDAAVKLKLAGLRGR